MPPGQEFSSSAPLSSGGVVTALASEPARKNISPKVNFILKDRATGFGRYDCGSSNAGQIGRTSTAFKSFILRHTGSWFVIWCLALRARRSPGSGGEVRSVKAAGAL